MGSDSQMVKKTGLILALLLVSSASLADIRLQDDAGNSLRLPEPAKRIISLSPHITELLFAAGAKNQIIGTVDFSNYPAQASTIPLVGQYNKLDFERILALKPDLIIAWHSGNSRDQLSSLEQLGLTVFYSEPQSLLDVSKSIRSFGQLLGSERIANDAADQYDDRLSELVQRYANKTPVEVFYQVWDRPLMTINGQHMISHVMQTCGGHNVFEDLPVLAPTINIEAVIEKDPAIIIMGTALGREHWLKAWQAWPDISAVKNGQIVSVDADHITRHTPRLLLGLEKICVSLEQARVHGRGLK